MRNHLSRLAAAVLVLSSCRGQAQPPPPPTATAPNSLSDAEKADFRRLYEQLKSAKLGKLAA